LSFRSEAGDVARLKLTEAWSQFNERIAHRGKGSRLWRMSPDRCTAHFVWHGSSLKVRGHSNLPWESVLSGQQTLAAV
jgi:hypothetical protein